MKIEGKHHDVWSTDWQGSREPDADGVQRGQSA